MLYELAAAIFALMLLCALLAAVGTLVFRGGISFRGWRWRPNALGFTVVALAAGLVLWRVFPEFLFIPIILPFFWFGRGRGHRGPTWTVRHRPSAPPAITADDRAIDAQFRRVEEP